jgi:hypothetical protein
MSRYEKINYDELEMLAAEGGIDKLDKLTITQRPKTAPLTVCATTYVELGCKPKPILKLLSAVDSCHVVVVPPVDIQP